MKKIVVFGDPVLTKQADQVVTFDQELENLVEEMHKTMIKAKGVGLAAPQIGVSRQICIVDLSSGEDPEERCVMINPEIVESKGLQKGEEGCLSFPGIYTVVERPQWVRVKCQNLKGETVYHEAEDFKAHAFCHEIDHLNGVLMTDRISNLKWNLLKRKIQKRVKAGTWAAA